MTRDRKVFIVGPGFIGLNVLEALVDEGYHVRALVRRPDAKTQVQSFGAEPVMGGLGDANIIAHHAFECDVTIHMATADDVPSVKAVLEGLKQRAEKNLPSIYIHTSGASCFDDGANGEFKTDKIWTDEKPAEINTIPDTAWHRDVDLEILKAHQEIGKKAKFAIMVPPLIYGYVERYGRLSIQIPTLTRFAIKNGFSGQIGAGKSVISAIHVRDLMKAYLLVLHHLETSPGSSPDLHNPYYFIEAYGDHEPSWNDIAVAIGEGLQQAGRLEDPKPRTITKDMYKDLFGNLTSPIFGLNTRTRADRLKKLGWKPTHKDWKSSLIEDEMPVILQE